MAEAEAEREAEAEQAPKLHADRKAEKARTNGTPGKPQAARSSPADAKQPTADRGEAQPKQPKTTAAEKSEEAAGADQTGTGRERKQVQAFKPTEAKEQVKFFVKQGKGTRLRDISNVHTLAERITSKDELMELLHNVMFKRKGTDHERKRNVMDFSGFTWEADQAASERSKVVGKLDKAHVTMLHRLLDIFQLPRRAKEEGQKSAKIDRLVEWLEAPSGNPEKKDLAEKAAKKKTASAKKATATKRKRVADVEGSATKKTKAVPSKAPTAKSASKKSKKAAAEEGIESEPEDDVPLGVVAKLPSDKALRAQVEKILASVDVRDFNLRALMQQLGEHYGTDVTSKKPLIKVTAIEYCINNAPPAPNSEDEEDDDDGDAEEDAHEDGGSGKEEDSKGEDGAAAKDDHAAQKAQQAAAEVMASVPDQQPIQEGADDVQEAAAEAKDVADCDAKEAAAEAAMVAADDTREDSE